MGGVDKEDLALHEPKHKKWLKVPIKRTLILESSAKSSQEQHHSLDNDADDEIDPPLPCKRIRLYHHIFLKHKPHLV